MKNCSAKRTVGVYTSDDYLFQKIKLELLGGESLEIFLEGSRIVDLGIAAAALRLGSAAVFLLRGNAAVIKTDGHHILDVSVEHCQGQRADVEKKVCG